MKGFLDLKKLHAEMGKTITEMEAVQEKMVEAEEKQDEEGLTAGKSLYTELSERFDKLQSKADEAKAHAKRLELQKEIEELSEPAGKTIPTEETTEGDHAQAIDHESDVRAKSGFFYEWCKGKTLDGKQQDALTPTSERLRSGDAAGSVVIPDRLACRILGMQYMIAFGKSIPNVFGNTMFSTATPAGVQTNPSAAQNLVTPDFRAVLQMLPFDVPSVFDRVSVVPTTSGTVTWPALVQTSANEFGGVAFQWLGEGAPKPETEPEFEQKEIQTHELAGYTEVSERLLSRSAINLESVLATLFKGAMTYTIDNAIIQGTGTGMPAGIIGTAGINSVVRNTAGAVNYLDLVNLKHAVKGVHRGGASFVLEDSVELSLELAVDTQGRPLFRESVANGPYDMLIGYSYIVGTNNPSVGTVGDIIYGNLKQYMLVMEEEITLARSEHVKFRENKIAFKVFTVIGGRLLQPRALAILDGES